MCPPRATVGVKVDAKSSRRINYAGDNISAENNCGHNGRIAVVLSTAELVPSLLPAEQPSNVKSARAKANLCRGLAVPQVKQLTE